jgi:hypothetical protein
VGGPRWRAAAHADPFPAGSDRAVPAAEAAGTFAGDILTAEDDLLVSLD